MKLRIMHSVDLEELADKLSGISKQTLTPLENSIVLIRSTAEILSINGNESIQMSSKIIDKVRKQLALADDCLNEVSTLMQGYINNFENQPVEPAEIQSPVSTPDPQPDTQLHDENRTVKYFDEKSRTLREKPDSAQEQE